MSPDPTTMKRSLHIRYPMICHPDAKRKDLRLLLTSGVTSGWPTTRQQPAFYGCDGLVPVQKLKRVGVLLIKLLTEALLLGTLLGAMLSSKTGFFNGVLGSIIALPVILGLHGYYASRVLAAIAWASIAKWLYPAITAAAFITHVLFIASGLWPDVSPQAKAVTLPFLIGGACIVFGCSSAGDQLNKKWSQVSLRPRCLASNVCMNG